MRLVAMCVAALVLMQVPAMAAIVSSLPGDFERGPSMWNPSFECLAWDEESRTLSVCRLHGFGNNESAEFVLTTSYTISFDGVATEVPSTRMGSLAANRLDEAYLALGPVDPTELHLEAFRGTSEEDEAFFENIRIAGTSVAPEPATLTIWGISALALAAATYRRQKRAGRNSKRVQAAVKEYLDACTGPSDHFRMLGSYLTRLADDPNWSKQDIEAFYDEVVVALHGRREHAEVA